MVGDPREGFVDILGCDRGGKIGKTGERLEDLLPRMDLEALFPQELCQVAAVVLGPCLKKTPTAVDRLPARCDPLNIRKSNLLRA